MSNNNKIIQVNRKELIELILDRPITDRELEDLHKNWRAFYHDPLGLKEFGQNIADYLIMKEDRR